MILYKETPSSAITGLTLVSVEDNVANNENEALEFFNNIRSPLPSLRYTLSCVGVPKRPGVIGVYEVTDLSFDNVVW